MALMTMEDLAKFLNLSPNTVRQYYKLNRDKLPPAISIDGSHPRWRRQTVDKWLKDKEQGN